MEVDQPKWIDACYAQKVLRLAEKDESIAVTRITVAPATAKGDNYTSNMHRISVALTRLLKGQEITETRTMIVKVAPDYGIRKEMITNAGIFQTEMSMMAETLPKMNALLNKLDITSMAARCLFPHDAEPLHLVIEDLTPAGFRMADRRAGLDLDHCLLAIRNLAAFHASSLILFEENPASVTKYAKGNFHKDQSLAPFFNAGTKAMALEVVKWPELDPRIAEKVVKIGENGYEKLSNAALPRDDDFMVLNHGDFWVNNMLFQYDEKQKPIDIMFVDFQYSHYAPRSLDILYFMGTSLSKNVRENHRELLLREYQSTLTNLMAELKCKTEPPSFDNLVLTMKARAMCEVIPSFTMLPVFLADENCVKDLDEMLKPNGDFDMPAYQGKPFKDLMMKILPYYESSGMLDL